MCEGGVRLGFDLETVNFLESQYLDISIISPLVFLLACNTAESAHLTHFDYNSFIPFFICFVS